MALSRYKNIVSLASFGGASILSRGTTTILALLYALRLSPADLGIYAIIIGIAEVAGILGDAGISQAMIRTYYDRHKSADAEIWLGEVIFTARIVGTGLLLVLMALAWLAWNALTAGTIPLWPYLPLAFAIAFFDRIGLMVNALCQALEKPLPYAFFSLTQTIATLIFAFVFVFILDMRALGALTGVLCALVVANIVRMIVMNRMIRPAFRLVPLRTVLDLLAYGVPLLPKQLAIWGRQMALRLVLAHLVPLGQVGAFFFANSVASTVAMGTMALEPAFTPLYMKKRVNDDADFRGRVLAFMTVVLGVLTPVYAAGVLLSADVARHLLPHGYGLALVVLPVLFLNLFFQTQEPFMTKQLIYHRRTGLASLITIVPIAAALASLPFVVPVFGLVGAAWAMALANALILVVIQLVIKRLEPSDYPAGHALLAGAILIATALFNVRFGPSSETPTELAVRALIAALIAAGAAAMFVWPNRKLVRRLIRA